jgi:CheY-like chemotaxis protein
VVTVERDSRRIEQLLAVSLLALFHPDPLRKDSRRYQTVVRGWRALEYVMLDRPRLDNRSYLMVREGQDCLVRYMLEGKACGFESRVLDFDTARGNPYMRIRWPEAIEFTYFRRGERVKVHLSGTINAVGNQTFPCTISDISQGGCGIELPVALEKGAKLLLNCELSNGHRVTQLPLTVCSARAVGRMHFHGCAFEDTPHPGKDDMSFFVVSRLAIERGKEAVNSAKRVLIVDADTDRAAALSRHLARRGIESIAALSALEGFYRLKALPPAAIAVAFQQKDLGGSEIVRVVHCSPEFASLPMVVYGMPACDATGAGDHATTLVPDGANMIHDAGTALWKLLS